MPIYRLECAMQFDDGRPGVEVDTREFEARIPIDAISPTQLYECAKPEMMVELRTLFGSFGGGILTSKPWL